MALYSLHHTHIPAGSVAKVADRISYICREDAAREILSDRMPVTRLDLAVHLAGSAEKIAADRNDRCAKNGRLAECFILALPKEATEEQRSTLVSVFADRVTKQAAGYIAAIHDAGKDAANPHAHIMAFDERQAREPGKRGRSAAVIGGSRNGWLDDMRATWTEVHNSMMTLWGYGRESMIDHRSLEAQGIDREPTRHDGPRRRAIEAKGITLPPRPPRRPRKGTERAPGAPEPATAPERPLTAWEREQIADLRARGANMPSEAECSEARKAGDPHLWRRTAEGGDAGDISRKDRQVAQEVDRAIQRSKSRQIGD